MSSHRSSELLERITAIVFSLEASSVLSECINLQPVSLIIAYQIGLLNAVLSRKYAKTPLKMPMLVLSGEKAGGQFLIDQGKLVNSNVEGVIVTGSGHWLMEEAPAIVVPKLAEFLNR